jgi:NAD(P)-dependent dehydrogenase (short-subunit alcohol dehydrogenase family)
MNAHLRYQPPADALRGRVIAITGAGEGIGRALALAAATHGAEVVLIGRTVSKLEAVHGRIAELGQAEACIAPLDLERAIARDYDALAEAIQGRFGRLDGLVHNAAILGALAPIEHYDVPTRCRVLHVNLTAAFALTQVLLPALRAAADASIVFTSSGVGRRPKAYWGAYSVSKFGIEALCGTLAEELGDAGALRVNALNPGPVRTRLRAQAYPAEDPATRLRPEHVLGPYLWLLSAASRGVNGQSLDCQPR